MSKELRVSSCRFSTMTIPERMKGRSGTAIDSATYGQCKLWSSPDPISTKEFRRLDHFSVTLLLSVILLYQACKHGGKAGAGRKSAFRPRRGFLKTSLSLREGLMASILSLCEKVRVKMAKGSFVTKTSETTTDRLSSTSTEMIGRSAL